MRLEWKYTLIINAFILVTMSAFFIISDRMVKEESILSVIRDYTRGATIRDIAGQIRNHITDIAAEYNVASMTERIRSVDLVALNKTELEVVEINVIDPNGLVIASLTGEGVDDKLDSDWLDKVMSRQMILRPKEYHGHWVIEYTVPYILSDSYKTTEDLGILQIMFSARGIADYSRQLRIRNLLYVAVVTVALTVFIIPLTGHLIVRRVGRLMETIAAVQAGDPEARVRDSSQDEIGRLSRSFNRMIERIDSEHTSRLAALGNLAAGVAHEVRNPLNSIAMTTQYLSDTIESEPDSDAQECLDVIAQQVGELNRIVEEFLQLTRPMEMNWKLVDLNAFLSDVVRSFASSLEIAKVKLICNYSRDMLYISIDRDKIRQAISNIIINSIQAMPDGGELRITTSRSTLQKAAIIEISDTGMGVSQENLNRLFEPYFTTKSDGTGLGLTITYRMIEAHNGEIKVESKKGQGTSFSIILPFSMTRTSQGRESKAEIKTNETNDSGSR